MGDRAPGSGESRGPRQTAMPLRIGRSLSLAVSLWGPVDHQCCQPMASTLLRRRLFAPQHDVRLIGGWYSDWASQSRYCSVVETTIRVHRPRPVALRGGMLGGWSKLCGWVKQGFYVRIPWQDGRSPGRSRVHRHQLGLAVTTSFFQWFRLPDTAARRRGRGSAASATPTLYFYPCASVIDAVLPQYLSQHHQYSSSLWA
jgi:hypothetical protein